MFHANVRTVQATPPDAVCNSIGKGISSVSSSNGLHANPRRCRPADPRKIIGFMKSAFFYIHATMCQHVNVLMIGTKHTGNGKVSVSSCCFCV